MAAVWILRWAVLVLGIPFSLAQDYRLETETHTGLLTSALFCKFSFNTLPPHPGGRFYDCVAWYMPETGLGMRYIGIRQNDGFAFPLA